MSGWQGVGRRILVAKVRIVADKFPAFQFYPGDWRKDPALRRCSLGARGTWIEMLCLMFECDARGVLSTGGSAWTPDEVCTAIGGDAAEVKSYIEELVSKGVCAFSSEGAFFSRRMVRDEQLRRTRAECGSKGGTAKARNRKKLQRRSKVLANAVAKPKQTTEGEDEVEVLQSEALASDNPDSRILEVFAHYRTYHPRAFPAPKRNSKEWKSIRARMAEGYGVDDLRRAIDGNHVSPFHCGENPGGTKYNALELIVRDGGKVQTFIEALDNHGKPVLSEKNRRNMRAADSYLERRKAEMGEGNGVF